MPDPHIVIRARDVTLALGRGEGRVEILRGIDLDIAAGTSVALLGASGSGKSSLMAVLAGLERATGGDIHVAGADFGALGEDALALARRGRIGIVLQAFHLLPTMTALENVAVPLELAGERDAFARAAEELAAVGLGHRTTHYPAQLSGGEQQRVAIARAIAPRPAILFADEPTGNLDAATGGAVLDLLFARQRETATTLLMITHDAALAARCARVLEMRDGRILTDRAGMSLAWRLALRDLRGGLGALRLLAACLFLGVAAIAGVGSLSSAIVAGLAGEGRTILGGDVAVSLTQRRASDAERTAIARLGRVAESARMQAMASRGGGPGSASQSDDGDATLVELKAVDAAYPLAGRLRLAPGALAALPGPGQAMVAPALVDRLGLHVGDRLRIGDAALTVAGVIAAEPDRLGDGFSLGPTVLTSMAGLEAARLIQPGSLYSWRYRIVLPAGSDAKAVAARLGKAFPPRRLGELRDSGNAAPGTRRFVEQIGQFLGLVGLTALVVAGIGVGNGVAAYLEARRPGIATLKTLGASSRLILRVYLIEIALVAAGAVAAALVAGALLPAVVAAVAGDALPASPRLGLYPLPLAMAAVEGLLVAAGFAIVPLARARAVSAASLFRGAVDGAARPPWRVLAGVAGAILLAAAIAVAGARTPWFAASFLAAAAALTGLLAALGMGVRAVAARLPRSRHPLLRLAVANLHAPAAQTGRLVVALGLGLSLFATLAVIQTNLSGQIRSTVPARAPSFFVLDIPSAGLDRFRALAARYAPAGDLVTVPSLRGPVVALNGRRVSDMKDIPEGAWILRGDRGLTFARDLPAGSTITAGRWWAKDYAGPPLVSIDEDAARVLKLRLGDEITVSALGVEVAARIASFRRIDWQTMGFNFVLVYSPGTFAGAPFGTMATLALPPAREGAFSRAATRAFPSLSLIRVRDVLATVGGLLGQMASAVAAASAVALAAGIAVLIGAVLAARRARVRDAVLLKLLGATRGQVLLVQGIEYGLLAAIVTLVALAVGAGAGWYVVTQVFALSWGPDWGIVALVLLAGGGLTLATGLIGALPALAARPAPALRSL